MLLDPARGARSRFHVPTHEGEEICYLASHSLGLLTKEAEAHVRRVLLDWAELGVDGHFNADWPWYSAAESLQAPMAAIVGALPEEVVLMNGLTVNMHLLLASFYEPKGGRKKILTEAGNFPSDDFALRSLIEHRGGDPATDLIIVGSVEEPITTEVIEAAIAEAGEELALVWWSGVHYLTGQRFDLKAISDAAHNVGSVLGAELAHAAGNVPLQLHDDGVDLAVWCTYKYLCGGPGSPGGAFVHQKHHGSMQPALRGWWGNDSSSRFQPGLPFEPTSGAAAWALSNPPILSLAPLRASLDLFADVGGMAALSERAKTLTADLEHRLTETCGERLRWLSPLDPADRGAMLSFQIDGASDDLPAQLQEADIILDTRKAASGHWVLRASAAPLYTGSGELITFVNTLKRLLR